MSATTGCGNQSQALPKPLTKLNIHYTHTHTDKKKSGNKKNQGKKKRRSKKEEEEGGGGGGGKKGT